MPTTQSEETMITRTHAGFALACLGSVACGDDTQAGGTGTIEVTSYGEAFIEEGIAASEVSDGWAVTFTKFEVKIGDVTVGGFRLEDPAIVDLVKPSDGEGQVLGSLGVPSGAYADAGFTIHSVHVVGSAAKGEESKSFDWTFDEPISYHGCETTTEVPKNGTGVFQITVHADHFFYDSLVSDEPALGFGALAAADTSGDGAITQEELAAGDIGGFDPGNEDVENLWDWLSALTATLGHVDGEGHCHAEPAQ
jgi:hypothetical protein